LLLFSFLYCDKREKSNQKRKKRKRFELFARNNWWLVYIYEKEKRVIL